MFRPLTQSLHRLSLVLPSTVACQAVPETNAMTKTQLWFCLSNQMKLNCLRETSVLPRDKSHVIRRIRRALPYFEFSFVLSVHIIALFYPLLLDRESQQQPAYIYKTKQIQIFCLGVNRVNRHPGACEFPLWGSAEMLDLRGSGGSEFTKKCLFVHRVCFSSWTRLLCTKRQLSLVSGLHFCFIYL